MSDLRLDSDIKTLTGEELETLRRACWEKDAAITREQQRRQALPFVWESEEQNVRTLRQVLGKTVEPGAEWQKPTSLLDAYVSDDSVTHNGERYDAVGRGAIFLEPGTTDPIQGEVWVQDDTTT